MYTIWNEDFETNGLGTRYTLSNPEFHTATSTINDDFLGRTDGNTLAGIAFSSSVSYTGSSGSYYFAANDTDESSLSSHTRTITFGTIDISDYENLNFSGLFAEDDFVDGFEDWDTDTRVYIEVSIDGGAYSKILQFVGSGFDSTPRLDSNLDGIGNSTALTDTFTSFSATIAGSGSTLDMRLVMENLNTNDEDIAFDNLTITGDRAADLSVFTTGFVDIFEGGQSDTVRVEVSGTPDASDVVRTLITWNADEYMVNGDATGSLTLTNLGSQFLAEPDGQIDHILTLTAIDDADDELLDQGIGQYLTIDVVSGDDAEMDALGPSTVTAVRIWDNDGSTGAGTDSTFLLHQEGFETDGAGTRYTLSRTELNNQNSMFGGDWFTRSTGGSDLQNANPGAETFGITGGSEGSWFFSVQDPNGGVIGPNTESLTITGIDIDDFENLQISLDLAEDDQDDGREDWNASTHFTVETRIDGGAWTEVVRIEGTDQTDHEPGLDTDGDGERDGPVLTESWQEFAAAIAGTGNDLDVRLTFNDFLFSGEDISIDDIRITGDAVQPGTFPITGDFLAFGDLVADNTHGGLDGVQDFSGFSSVAGLSLTVAGGNAPSELVLGQEVRLLQQGSQGIGIDIWGIVEATNVEDGWVMLSGGNLEEQTDYPYFIIGTESFGSLVDVTLEIGPSTAPSLIMSTPADGAVNVDPGAPLQLVFDENVILGEGVIEIRRVSDDGVARSFDVASSMAVSVTGATVSVALVPPLPGGDEYYVTIAPGAIRDLAGNPHEGLSDPTALVFDTNAPPEVDRTVVYTLPGQVESHFIHATDPESDPLSFTLISQASNAVTTLGSDGSYTVQTGNDGTSFRTATYEVTDGTANVTVGELLIFTRDENMLRNLRSGAANDVLRGGLLDDSMGGGAGEDLLFGEAGNDSLEGDDGADSALGGTGNDTLLGGAGADTLKGEDGDDRLDGGDDNDTLVGGDGNDTLIGGFGDDRLNAGADDDTVIGGLGADDVLLGDGDDLFSDHAESGAAGSDSVSGGAGRDTITSQSGNDTLLGEAGADSITGGDEGDSIHGGGGSDTIDAGAGNDTVRGGGGADDVALGGGNDLFTDDVQTGAAGMDTIDGNTGNDTIIGGGGADLINGGADSDSLSGGGGADTLIGGNGDDSLAGEGSRDSISGGAGNDFITAGSGDDTVVGGADNDTLIGQKGADSLSGGNGDDRLSGGADSDTLLGGDGHDSLVGGQNADLIEGGAGDDTITGGTGADTVIGGSGRDLAHLDEGSDVFTDLSGHNTVFGGDGDDSIGTMNGGVSTGNNIYHGELGRDLLTGGDGNDSLYGGAQNDTLIGGNGADSVEGGTGGDTAQLGGGADVYVDSAQQGAAGSDSVAGDGGSDTIGSAGGNDTLTGGTGGDHFVFAATIEDVTVSDFGTGADVLEIDTALWGGPLTQAHLDALSDTSSGTLVLEFGAGQSITLTGLSSNAGLLDDILLI
ncbi:MAG: Ig-like domain-containing protein [Pelagimonas sp.]|jgi:Ca2+-binding RTX toxin-like protein|nr:Ig-like domain-containing protein [Pelagimonas sp.]